jgi:putative membrane protein
VEEEVTQYRLTHRDLLLAATTSSRFGVALSLVGAAFSQIDQLFSEDQIIRFVESHIPTSTSFAVIVTSIVAIFVISWLISFGSTIITYYDFSVEVHDDELLISRGLFERTQLTIPFNRIQAVQIKEGILRQPFGYASLVIESAGYGEKEGNSTMLFPLIAREKMLIFINDVIPDYHTNFKLNNKSLTPAALRRYLLRMTWISLIIIAVIWNIIPYGVYSWFMLIPGWLLGYQQYRDASVASSNSTVKLSFRMLSKTTVILKRYRVQAVQIKQNPFQSRLGLSNLTFHVASGNQGRSFTVKELTLKRANKYWMWVSHNHDQETMTSDSSRGESHN